MAGPGTLSLPPISLANLDLMNLSFWGQRIPFQGPDLWQTDISI